MPEATPTPAVKPILSGHDVSTAMLQAFGHALVDWWYLWLLLIGVAIALAMLNGWSRRLERRSGGRRSSGRRR